MKLDIDKVITEAQNFLQKEICDKHQFCQGCEGKYERNCDFYFLKKFLEDNHIAFVNEKSFCELEDKIESGLLVERPCKIGDKFYVVIRDLPPQEWIVDEFIETKERIVVSGWKNTKDGGFWRLFPIDDFGKKIFTTKEAAEEKLKELGGKTK